MSSLNEKKSENIKDLENEVVRYGYQNGVAEISIGIAYLLLGLMLFFYKPGPIEPIYAVFFALTCLGILFFAGTWLIRKLKGKFVWEKTGYYVAKGSYSKLVWVFLTLSLLSVAFAAFSVRLFPSEIAIASFGACFFFGLISQFLQTGRLKRFLYVSFLPLFISGVCIFLDISLKQSIVFMFLATGFAFLISGIIVYKKFRGEYDG